MCSPRDPPSTPRNSSYRNSHGRPHGPGTGPSPAARRSRKKHWNHPKLSPEGTGGPTNAGSDQGRHSALCGDGQKGPGAGRSGKGHFSTPADAQRTGWEESPPGRGEQPLPGAGKQGGLHSQGCLLARVGVSVCVYFYWGKKKNGRVNRFCRIHVSA